MQYGLAQAKARLSELTNLVDSGEDVIIAKHGRPSYRLISIDRLPAIAWQSPEKTAEPSNLNDMAEFIARTRRLTRNPTHTENFVANWRQNERY